MKVSELIALLQEAEPDTEICLMSQDGCCGDQEFHEVIEAYFDEGGYLRDGKLVRSKDFPHGQFLVYMTAAHGADSCRKAGMIKTAMRAYEEERAAWKAKNEESK